jgi:uncharacterized UPF0160 family protein
MTTMPKIEGLKNIMEAESKCLADLVDFNQKYAKYIECSQQPNSACSTTEKSYQPVETAYQKLMNNTNGDIVALNRSIAENKNISVEEKKKYKEYVITKQQYDASFNSIKATHSDFILPVRKELDDKLKELYAVHGSKTEDNRIVYDNVMYTGLLWTVLTSSLVYYVFIHM